MEKERIYVYIVDELGFIKVWDLTYLIKYHLSSVISSIGHMKTPLRSAKVSFNPKRKENVDVTIFAKALRKE